MDENVRYALCGCVIVRVTGKPMWVEPDCDIHNDTRPIPPEECDNYRPPLTCLTAPSSEAGRCDKCRARVLPPEVRVCRTCGHGMTDQEYEDWFDQCEPCVLSPAE